jgi:flavin reductase (DIM6/NTAB) family NADH-FMN oxidoreductase RutF
MREDDARRRLRDTLAQVPTGVVVVTAPTADGVPLGMTMSSFVSVSLDPPLVLFSIDRRSRGIGAWLAAAGYAINVLSTAQGGLANRFARPGSDKWAGVGSSPGLHGAPLLDAAVAWLECTARERIDGGDHVIFVARVDRHWAAPERRALVFHRGRFAQVAELPGPGPAAELGDPALAGWPLAMHY